MRRTVAPRGSVRAEMVRCKVSLFPIAGHSVSRGADVVKFRFASKIRFLNQSETISVGLRRRENGSLLLFAKLPRESCYAQNGPAGAQSGYRFQMRVSIKPAVEAACQLGKLLGVPPLHNRIQQVYISLLQCKAHSSYRFYNDMVCKGEGPVREPVHLPSATLGLCGSPSILPMLERVSAPDGAIEMAKKLTRCRSTALPRNSLRTEPIQVYKNLWPR